MVLLGFVSLKKVAIREGLQPRSLADRQAAALRWVRVDEIMTVLGYVAGNSGAGSVIALHPEPVSKFACFPVRMIWR